MSIHGVKWEEWVWAWYSMAMVDAPRRASEGEMNFRVRKEEGNDK